MTDSILPMLNIGIIIVLVIIQYEIARTNRRFAVPVIRNRLKCLLAVLAILSYASGWALYPILFK